MIQITDEGLLERARSVRRPRRVRHGFVMGNVGCALVTDKGSVFTGVCIDTVCSMGFCAEQSAIAAMVTHGEYIIRKIVAVSGDGKPVPPCGRCREFMHQIHEKNFEAEVIIGEGKSVKLKELLPLPWDAKA